MLSQVPLSEHYDFWAREASPEVAKVTVQPRYTAATPAGIEIVIAGGGNTPLSGSAQAVVQNFISDRAAKMAPLARPIVVTATSVEVRGVGVVTVRARDLLTVQTGAQRLWSAYLASQDIGARLYASQLVKALMDAGAVDLQEIYLRLPTGLVTSSHLLGSAEVARASDAPLSQTLTWATI
jgi:hypothetical protein